jgi:transposase
VNQTPPRWRLTADISYGAGDDLAEPRNGDRQTIGAAKGFVALPKRWIVERSIGWLNRCRRLAKDWENLNLSAFIFLRLASIRLMLRKLCN